MLHLTGPLGGGGMASGISQKMEYEVLCLEHA